MSDKANNPEGGNKPGSKTGNKVRRILMIGGVAIVALICLALYLHSGRYIGTDNSYIKSAKIMITPEVSGVIQSVNVNDNQHVKAGDALFTIDPQPYKIALSQAEANLGVVKSHVEQLKADYRQKLQDIDRAKAIATYNTQSYNRAAALARAKAISREDLDATTSKNAAAQKDIAMLQEELSGITAELGGDPNIASEEHPSYKAALAQRDAAKLNLDRTFIKAPIDGLAGGAPRQGDYARGSVPAMNLVGTRDVWIEANYKETELTDVVPGQPVEIEVDTYPGHTWHGKVESISPATGSEFSVLPAQNATGNWVKVVQRIAVRIAIEHQKNEPELRAGMSTHVVIDTGSYPHMPG